MFKMRKFLFFLILFCACKKGLSFYPSKEFYNEYTPKEILLENLNFGQLVDSIKVGLYNKNRYSITLEESKKIYKISPFTYSGGFIKERNALDVESDSIWWKSDKQSIKKLVNLIELHYGTNRREHYLPHSYQRSFLKLTLDSSLHSAAIKEKLLFIIKSCEDAQFEHKDSCSLRVLIHYWKDPTEQPHPPLDITKQKDDEK